MPDKKHTPTRNNKGNKGTKNTNTHEQDQEEMHRTGSSEPSLTTNPLENFERDVDNSIQRGQRITQNERQAS